MKSGGKIVNEKKESYFIVHLRHDVMGHRHTAY